MGQNQARKRTKLATDLEESLRVNLSAVIPADWRTTWPVELQKLFDARTYGRAATPDDKICAAA